MKTMNLLVISLFLLTMSIGCATISKPLESIEKIYGEVGTLIFHPQDGVMEDVEAIYDKIMGFFGDEPEPIPDPVPET